MAAMLDERTIEANEESFVSVRGEGREGKEGPPIHFKIHQYYQRLTLLFERVHGTRPNGWSGRRHPV